MEKSRRLVPVDGPFLRVIESEDSRCLTLFEIKCISIYFFPGILRSSYADRVKLLEAQDISSAFASYYELAFVFQLEYPKECQTVSQVSQLFKRK